jgi:hypothetical protein
MLPILTCFRKNPRVKHHRHTFHSLYLFVHDTIYIFQWNEMSGSKCLPFALVFAICAGIFQLIALASPYWDSIGAHGDKYYAGLWMACTQDATGRNICLDFFIVEGKTHPHTHKHAGALACTHARGTCNIYIYIFKFWRRCVIHIVIWNYHVLQSKFQTSTKT